MTDRRFLILVTVLVLGILGSLVVGRLGHPFTAAGYRKLKLPFEAFPREFGRWKGEDFPVPEAVVKVGGWDRHLRRIYYTSDRRQAVDLFISYYGNKQRGLEAIYHNPTICLPSSGWDQVSSNRRRVTLTDAAKEFEVSLDHFRKESSEIAVLNFFVIDGEVLEQPPRNKPFWIGLEKFRVSTDPGYFVQVRLVLVVSGDPEEVDRRALRFLEETGRFIFLHF